MLYRKVVKDVAKDKNQAKIKFVAETEQFNKQIKAANGELSALRAELGLNATEMKGMSDATEKLTERKALLEKQLEMAGSKTEALRKKLEVATRIYGENSDEVLSLKKQIALAATAEAKIRQEIDKTNNALNEQASESNESETAIEKLRKAIDEQESELAELKEAYSNAVVEQGQYSKEAKDLAKQIRTLSGNLSDNRGKINRAESAADQLADATDDAGDAARDADDGFTVWKGTLSDLASEAIQGAWSGIQEFAANLWGLSEETREFRTNMGKVETAFGDAGFSAETAASTYEDFYALLGDEGQATEAANLLARLAKNEQQLAEYTHAATGAYAMFGDSMPVEGLIESANETAKTGTVTGSLADALNWATMSSADWVEAFNGHPKALKKFQSALKSGMTVEEAFNEALTKCTTESQREQVIRQALNGLYGDAADAYAENNAQIMDANRAQAEYNSALAGLGHTMEPLTTAWTSGMASIMESFGDMLDEVDMDKLVGALEDGFEWVINTAFPAIKDGIQWFLDNKGAVITGVSAIGAAFAGIKVFSFAKSFGNLFGLFNGGGSGAGGGGGGSGGGGGIFGAFSKLATMPVTTVLKGIGNLSIILVGLGAMAALVALVAPSITSLCDAGEFAKMLVAIGLVGLLGTGMAKLAGSVGNIPVSTVAKGLADIAIIMAGLGVLTAAIAWVAPYVTDMCDSGTFAEMVVAIGLTGLIGSALAALAGVIGMIPIPVVLTGLANIALAVGGFTAIISAFGALSMIDGFDEFIASGGEALVAICFILGEVAGALIGGIGAGLALALPPIGESLSLFAEALQPMFDIFAGVDAEGVKNFAIALAALIAVIAGEQLVSMITGKIDYVGLGVDLGLMAVSLSGFFSTIMTFPDGGFEKATALFNCLANLDGLPKEGGVVGWFQGEIDYTKMADGLNQLAGTVGFFTAIQPIPEAAFTKATQLFDCLAGIKSLPQDGGVVGWFMGEVDFTKIATGVQTLASAGMIAALTAISTIPAVAFTSLISMFDALAGIKAMPKEGGVVGWFSGDSSTGLTNVSSQLPTVAQNIATFFSNLGGRTNFTPIKTLFDTLGNIELNTNVADKGFWTGVSQLGAMGTELSAFATNGASFFSTVNTLNLKNLTSFWDALGGASGLPAALKTLNSDVGTELSGMLSTTQTKMDEIRDEINLDGTSDGINGTLGTILNAVSAKFQSIFKAIKDKMTAAKTAVSGAISEIKNKFDFSWSLPNLKLPHVKISGKFQLDPPSVPKFSVSWYKEGGILTNPTIFGALGGKLLGGGEAGKEAVAPIDVLLGYVTDAVRGVFGELELPMLGGDRAFAERLENSNNFMQLERMVDAIESMADRPIELYVDSHRIAVATASASDNVSGHRLNLRTRGLALE